MLAVTITNIIAKFVLFLLPKSMQKRINENSAEKKILLYNTNKIITKPGMTLIEGVFATLLFDLALFGLDNLLINSFIKLFTKFQNSWHTPFKNPEHAQDEIIKFCNLVNIPLSPWMWSKHIKEYTCLNDFFSRHYSLEYLNIGTQSVVSPASSIVKLYNDNESLCRLLIKGCDYHIDNVGLWPVQDVPNYAKQSILIGYLSPSDYHRVHSPIEGTCVYCKIEDSEALSASVKFFGGKFNLMNKNKRLVVVLEQGENVAHPLRVALVIIGGVGVNTIEFDEKLLNSHVKKGQEVSTFLAGGSAFAMFSNRPLQFDDEFQKALNNDDGCVVHVEVGQGLGSV